MTLRFLRLFAEFRDLEDLVSMQARNFEASDGSYKVLSAVNAELRTELEDLREANQNLTTDKLLLQDRLESAIGDKEHLWATTNRAMEGERYAYQTMVNHAIQKNGGGIPFPDAHALPPAEIRKPQLPGPIGRSSRMLPSEMAHRATSQFVREFVESLGPEKVA